MSVMIAVLHMGKMSVSVAQSLLVMQADNRYTKEFVFTTDVPGESNRNRLVKRFLGSGHEYLLMIDEDNAPIENPLDLIELNKDIIGLPTPVYKANQGGLMWMVCEDFGKDGAVDYRAYFEKQKGLQKVAAVGSGCLLIHRRALEKIKAPFMREWSEDGIATVGQDIAFCKRAKTAGIEIWVHWDYSCSHDKTINLLELM